MLFGAKRFDAITDNKQTCLHFAIVAVFCEINWYLGAEMVFCIMPGCGNRSERNYVTPAHIAVIAPPVRQHEGDSEVKKVFDFCCNLLLLTLTETKLKYGRVCFRHFMSGDT